VQSLAWWAAIPVALAAVIVAVAIPRRPL